MQVNANKKRLEGFSQIANLLQNIWEGGHHLFWRMYFKD
jgi:hypothetical protein